MELNRRNFLQGVVASSMLGGAGCCTMPWCETPALRFGVISDIHITTPESAALFEQSLVYFRSRQVDAVMVCGDLTDWGLKSSLEYVEQTWQRVFPNSLLPNGQPVVKLFCTGNHDFEGWRYGDMTMEMHANGYDESEALVKLDLPKVWKEVFHETWEPVRVRSVKGFDFISTEWGYTGKFADWMQANAARFKGRKPFFYFQHLPVANTTSDSAWEADGGDVTKVLKNFPNAVSFTGHTHNTFNDERSIWQDTFTALAVPSLSYMTVPSDTENGGGARNGTCLKAMPRIPARRDLRGGQGYVVSVYDNRIEFERRDLEEGGVMAMPTWVAPWPTGEKPFAVGVRESKARAPQFPIGATLETYTRNTENRSGKWTIVMTLRFPSAQGVNGLRVRDYEVWVEPKDGSKPLVKRFLTPAFHKLAKYEPKMQEVWFNVAELPQDKPYVIKVMPRNWFGMCGKALVSRQWHGKPGLDRVKN